MAAPTEAAVQMAATYEQLQTRLFDELLDALRADLPEGLIDQLRLAILAEMYPGQREEIQQKILQMHQPEQVQVQAQQPQQVQSFVERKEKPRKRGFDGGSAGAQNGAETLNQASNSGDAPSASQQEQLFTFGYESIEDTAMADSRLRNFVFAQRSEDRFMGIDLELTSDGQLTYYNGVGSFALCGRQIDLFFGVLRVKGEK